MYVPNGQHDLGRVPFKLNFSDTVLERCETLKKEGRKVIICGDYNTAHKEIDLKNPKTNVKNTGFLPEERAWLDKVFGEYGYADAFRAIPQEPEQYTWWSNRGQAYAKNVGWRIDYHVVTRGLENKIRRTEIYKDERFSDHAPLIMDYDWAHGD